MTNKEFDFDKVVLDINQEGIYKPIRQLTF